MDKDICKRLLRDADLNVAPFITLTKVNKDQISFENVKETLGLPVFIKPASEGSSVGVSKVFDNEGYHSALDIAFQHGNKIIIEQGINGREIECAISGNDYPKASVCGEVILNNEFYSYHKKYLSANSTKTEVPASLTPEIQAKIQKVAIQAYQALSCTGMARVDVFLTESGEVIINEINTLPGFPNISMYPKLQEASGISYSDLITHLINLALEKK